MADYVQYTPITGVKKSKKPKKSEERVFENLNPLQYNLVPVQTMEIEESTNLYPEAKQETVVSEQSDPMVKSKLDKVVDYALSKAKGDSTHYCARYVRQALESQGFKPGNSINGWEYERAAANMGWNEVTDGSIKRGDLIVTKKHDGKGHVALATKDDADIFNDRESSVSDFVSRGVPYAKSKVKSVKIFRAPKALFGMKFARWVPPVNIYNQRPKVYKPKTTLELLTPTFGSKSLKDTNVWLNDLTQETPKSTQQEPVVYVYSDPQDNYNPPSWQVGQPVTRQYMFQLYSNELANRGLDLKYAKDLLAHDMFESGADFSHQSGRYNFGGIKGKGTVRKTLEEVNGQKVSTVSSFKDYNSPADYVKDKVRMMDEKYHAFNGGEYIDAVMRGGYATDSAYKLKFLNIRKGLK